MIDRARFAHVSWAADGRSFFYARLPRPDPAAAAATDAHLRVYRHRLGEDPDRDRLILDPDRLPGASAASPSAAAQIFPALVVPPGSDYVLAELRDGVSPELAI